MATTSATTPTTRKNLGWLWYFLILTVLAVAATSVLVVYNLRLQLKPERLEEAQLQWKQHRPANYLLKYSIQINEQDHLDEYEVTVENHKVTSALFNGRAEPSNRLFYYGMEKLFTYIDTNLENDQKKGQPRTYQRAIFDPDTGALRWYVRRVMGGRERVEITVKPLEVSK